MTYQVIESESWAGFKAQIVNDLYEDGRFKRGKYLFRGQGGENWSLSPSFDRWYHGELKNKVATAKKLLDQFAQECELEDLSEEVRNSDILMLSLGQHHGLPTRLLDWSESPYVSAFFAFSSHVRATEDSNDKIAIWVIDSSDPIWNSEFGCEIVNVPSFGNERIKNQHGKFTYLRTPQSSIEEYVASYPSEGKLIKYVLPTNDAVNALADLDSMGINFARIYPGLHGNAMSAQVRVLAGL